MRHGIRGKVVGITVACAGLVLALTMPSPARADSYANCSTSSWRAWCQLQESGSQGWQVVMIQDVLKEDYAYSIMVGQSCARGDVGAIDGYFGPNTQTAVQMYQYCHSLNADGKVGSATWGFETDTASDHGLEARTKDAGMDGQTSLCYQNYVNGTYYDMCDTHCDNFHVGSTDDIHNELDVNPGSLKIWGYWQYRYPRIGTNDVISLVDNRTDGNGSGGCHVATPNWNG